jgi:hypothetical protein
MAAWPAPALRFLRWLATERTVTREASTHRARVCSTMRAIPRIVTMVERVHAGMRDDIAVHGGV